MSVHRLALPALLVLWLASCGSMRGEPAVRLDPDAADLTSRWNAELSTPRMLRGAVGITGTAWMASGQEEGSTRVDVQIRNAAPGGVHPWQVHRGRCGANRGSVGAEDAYGNLMVGEQGRASATATLDFTPNDARDYFVAVYAAPTNRDLVIACGNLAAPAN